MMTVTHETNQDTHSEGAASAGPGLIDWPAALTVANRLIERGGEALRAAERAEAAAPRFRNRGFELSPLPLFVRGAAHAALTPSLEAYVSLLGKASALYLADPEVRAWYGLSPGAEALIAAEAASGRDPEVQVCRLDGYLEQDTERLRILENNADSPAGTLFTPRVHAVVLATLNSLTIPVPPHAPAVTPSDTALLEAVLSGAVLSDAASGRENGAAKPHRSVAILQPDGSPNAESVEMVGYFRSLGVDCFLADPREVEVRAGRASAGGRAIDACWNKVNTVAWELMARQDPGLNERWCGILTHTDLVHVNPFASRYVAESKLTLALVQEPRFAGLFDDEERALAERLLPWTRRVRRDPELTGPILDEQHRYVLKEPYDIRGDGVTVGRAVSRSAWVGAVERALDGPAVVQEYIAPAAYPVLRATDGAHGPGLSAVAMPASLDTYLIGGRVVFPGSKAGLQARINVFQGGRKLAVHVTSHDTAAADAPREGGS